MNQPAESFTNEFVEFWNDTLAEKFERFRDILVNGFTGHSETALQTLELPAGTRILDIGCGWGDTTLMLARKAGPDSHVLGVDCVDRFLDKGRRDAAAEKLHNIEFLAADAESHPFPGNHDLAFARFGTMFFENPVAALRNIRRALKPGGRVLFIVWRAIEHNPWLGLARNVVLEYLPEPDDDGRSCGPGPFSQANREMVTKQLEIAGYTDIDFTRHDDEVTVGNSLEEAIDFQLSLGPAGEVFREAGEEAEEKRDEIERALAAVLADHLRDGKVVLPSSSWMITAKNPD